MAYTHIFSITAPHMCTKLHTGAYSFATGRRQLTNLRQPGAGADAPRAAAAAVTAWKQLAAPEGAAPGEQGCLAVGGRGHGLVAGLPLMAACARVWTSRLVPRC
jgi:hypothetical protein